MNQLLDKSENAFRLSHMTNEETPKYITVKQAAIRMEISDRTVRRLILRGKLKAKRMTPIERSRYMVAVSSIEEFEERNQ